MQNIVARCLILLLVGCTTVPSLQPVKAAQSASQPILIRSPAADANWQILGVSPDGNVLNELDKRSIERNGDWVLFRGRKTIFNPKKETFGVLPEHKISINTWLINCAKRTFRILDMTLFGADHQQRAYFSYKDSLLIKDQPVVANSASYQQLQWVCNVD